MTSFTEDMRRRGWSPASRTLELEDRARRARSSAGLLARLAVGAGGRRASGSGLADHETMAIETLHVREALVPGLTAARPREQLVLRAPPRARYRHR